MALYKFLSFIHACDILDTCEFARLTYNSVKKLTSFISYSQRAIIRSYF